MNLLFIALLCTQVGTSEQAAPDRAVSVEQLGRDFSQLRSHAAAAHLLLKANPAGNNRTLKQFENKLRRHAIRTEALKNEFAATLKRASDDFKQQFESLEPSDSVTWKFAPLQSEYFDEVPDIFSVVKQEAYTSIGKTKENDPRNLTGYHISPSVLVKPGTRIKAVFMIEVENPAIRRASVEVGLRDAAGNARDLSNCYPSFDGKVFSLYLQRHENSVTAMLHGTQDSPSRSTSNSLRQLDIDSVSQWSDDADLHLTFRLYGQMRLRMIQFASHASN